MEQLKYFNTEVQKYHFGKSLWISLQTVHFDLKQEHKLTLLCNSTALHCPTKKHFFLTIYKLMDFYSHIISLNSEHLNLLHFSILFCLPVLQSLKFQIIIIYPNTFGKQILNEGRCTICLALMEQLCFQKETPFLLRHKTLF